MKRAKIIVSIALIISIAAALALPFSAVPASADGMCGPSLYWNYDANTRTLTVSGSGNMYDFTHDSLSYGAYPWKEASAYIRRVVVEEGCTKIGSNAFVRCTALSDVSLPKESLEYIGEAAFSYCLSLVSFTVPDSVTAMGDGVFQSCLYIKGISFGKGLSEVPANTCSGDTALNYVRLYENTAGVGNRAFYNCAALRDINLENLETLGQNSFYGCSSLKSVHLGEKISYIGGNCFYGCSTLTDITIDGSPEYIEGKFGLGTPWYDAVPAGFTVRFDSAKLFYKDDGRETAVIPEEARIITASAFVSVSSLKEVIFHDGIEKIESNAFYNTVNLKSVYIPDSVLEIGEGAFGYYSKLGIMTLDTSFVIRGRGHGTAYRYAVENGIVYECCHEFETAGEGEKLRCALCGFETSGAGLPSCDHSRYEASEFEADCENPGYTLEVCLDCGLSFRKNVTPALGHESTVWDLTRLPDCSREGEIIGVCPVCNKAVDVKYIEKTAHTPSEKTVVIKDATCTEDGLHGVICTVCGEVLSSEIIRALGHDPGEWVVITTPSDGVPGYRVKFCRRCGVASESEWFSAAGERVPDESALETLTDLLYGAARGETFASESSLDYYRDGIVSVKDIAMIKRLGDS